MMNYLTKNYIMNWNTLKERKSWWIICRRGRKNLLSWKEQKGKKFMLFVRHSFVQCHPIKVIFAMFVYSQLAQYFGAEESKPTEILQNIN